jgi:hypothetical protein
VYSSEHRAKIAQNKQVAAIHDGLQKRRHNWLHAHMHTLAPWIPAKELRKLQQGNFTECSLLLTDCSLTVH